MLELNILGLTLSIPRKCSKPMMLEHSLSTSLEKVVTAIHLALVLSTTTENYTMSVGHQNTVCLRTAYRTIMEKAPGKGHQEHITDKTLSGTPRYGGAGIRREASGRPSGRMAYRGGIVEEASWIRD